MKIFDILGPIMIGPSSSHTAGACRIAKMAATIADKDFKKVVFELHGSFAETYKGHGTDRALLAGVMGISPDDERLRDSFEIAKKLGLEYEFKKINLQNVHPNTVKIIFTYFDETTFDITGSSIGGGNYVIIDINSTAVTFSGEYPTLILKYNEQRGIIAFVSSILAESGYNIESLKTIKNNDIVTLILETDENISDDIKKQLMEDKRFIFSKYICVDR